MVFSLILFAVVAFVANAIEHDTAFPPLPLPPMGYSTWQWFPGDHWGKEMVFVGLLLFTVCFLNQRFFKNEDITI